MRQITVMHGPERRRRWNDEERLRILGSPSGSNPSDFSRILASAFDSLDSL